MTDRPRDELNKWPWRFAGNGDGQSPELRHKHLDDYCAEPIGAQFITGKDDAFVMPSHYLRRFAIPPNLVRAYGTGEDLRNWTCLSSEYIVFPYDGALRPLKEPLIPALLRHLKPYREVLENSVISGSTKKKETNLKWFEFRRLARAKFQATLNIIISHDGINIDADQDTDVRNLF